MNILDVYMFCSERVQQVHVINGEDHHIAHLPVLRAVGDVEQSVVTAVSDEFDAFIQRMESGCTADILAAAMTWMSSNWAYSLWTMKF